MQLCEFASAVVVPDLGRPLAARLACLAVVWGWQVLPQSQLVANGPVGWLAAVQKIHSFHPMHFACQPKLWDTLPRMLGVLLAASTLAAGWPARHTLQQSCASAANACMAMLEPSHKVEL